MAWQVPDGQRTEGEAAEDMRYVIHIGDHPFLVPSFCAVSFSTVCTEGKESKHLTDCRDWQAARDSPDDLFSRVLGIHGFTREVYGLKTVRWSPQGCQRPSTAT